MESYKIEFIKFALSRNVLKFGEFALKSGRKSPYFFNAGLFSTGADLARLGEFYAKAIQSSAVDFVEEKRHRPLANESVDFPNSTNNSLVQSNEKCRHIDFHQCPAAPANHPEINNGRSLLR